MALGIFLVVFNLIGLRNGIYVPPGHGDDPSFAFGYYLGSCLFGITGLVFLFAAYRINRKLQAKQRDELLNAFRDLPEKDRF